MRSSLVRPSTAGLTPHVDASLVKPQRTTFADVNLVLKLVFRDRLLTNVAALAGALASEIPLWWWWRER
jgi:hypothetical protein